MKKYPGIPDELQPLSAFAYFWYSVLYAIPLIGFIFLVIFCFDGSNVNRRNYSRSYFVGLLLALLLLTVLLIFAAALGFSGVLADTLS